QRGSPCLRSPRPAMRIGAVRSLIRSPFEMGNTGGDAQGRPRVSRNAEDISAVRAVPQRVLIRTFSPTTNANYGGILQAWALQRFRRGLGVATVVDSTTSPRFGRRAPFRTRLRDAIIRLVPATFLPSRLHAEKLRPRINSPLLNFAPRRIRTTALLDAKLKPR